MQTQLTKEQARKVLKIVDAGLVSGLGKAEPGEMCVMAALNFALGFRHSDKVDCVHPVVRTLDIALNDSMWSSNQARTKGMRREAIAKLGSSGIDSYKYVRYVALHVVKEIVPSRLREMGLEKEAKDCETAINLAAAKAAARAAAGAAAGDAAGDAILTQLAEISTRALIECGSQGSKWLDICED